jgi:hypothetical protein
VIVAAPMWMIGILFLGAAVAGRSIKILGNELPTLRSRFARIALGAVGATALVLGGVVFIVNPLPETDTTPAPDRTITSPTATTPVMTSAPGKPGAITNAPELTNLSPIGTTPAATFTPGRPVTIPNTTPGVATVSPTVTPPAVLADSSGGTEATDKPLRNIQNAGGLCMDVAGPWVIIATCHSEPGYASQNFQKWKVYGDHNIQNANGLCMEASGGWVRMAPCHTEPGYTSQTWTWRGYGDYNIHNAANDLCLSLPYNQPATLVIMVPCHSEPQSTFLRWHWNVLP